MVILLKCVYYVYVVPIQKLVLCFLRHAGMSRNEILLLLFLSRPNENFHSRSDLEQKHVQGGYDGQSARYQMHRDKHKLLSSV